MTERVMTDANGRKYIISVPEDLMRNTIQHVHELQDELARYKKIIADQDAMLERQTARIVDLQTHIENFDGEDR